MKDSEIKQIDIGSRVAEQEVEGLKTYFLKTPLWDSILNNQVDIIFGCKGSGKSALYTYLPNEEYDLFAHNIHLLLAENPRGAVAFKDLNTSPPTNEFEFKSIWKLYFIVLISQKLSEEHYTDTNFKIVVEKLQASDLLPRRLSFTAIVKMVRDYIRRINPTFEPNASLDQHSGMINKVGVKISLIEPSTKDSDKGVVSLDYLLELIDLSLKGRKEKIWLAIDRLDAIFQENYELEANALRTLFQVYIELQQCENLRLIIFLRDDIWNRIIEKGFRETSHITKTAVITWDKNSLFNLLMNRIQKNQELLVSLKLEDDDPNLKEELFRKIFPSKTMEGNEFNFEWLVSKIRDGLGNASPRELIHLVAASIKNEIRRISEEQVKCESLISNESLVEGLKEASKTKLETFIAEYPGLKIYIFKLKGKKSRFRADELKDIWNLSKKDTSVIINNLIKFGFLKNESKEETYTDLLVPIIFRPALGIQFGPSLKKSN
jgi:hypothetical protein